MSSPFDALDTVIHAPKRLAAMAMLDATDGTDFAFLREHLQLSESDLSKQMSALQAAGYVKVSKSGRGRGSRTTYAITRAGRTAYRRHRTALVDLIGRTPTETGSATSSQPGGDSAPIAAPRNGR